jgi:quercetin dioxygenase-like cupin family protein
VQNSDGEDKTGEMPASQVLCTADMLDYRQGAIVSRTLFRCATGTVTLFAFDEGQFMNEHTVPYDALVQILEGEARITIADAGFRVQGGESILLPGNQPHALEAVSRSKCS